MKKIFNAETSRNGHGFFITRLTGFHDHDRISILSSPFTRKIKEVMFNLSFMNGCECMKHENAETCYGTKHTFEQSHAGMAESGFAGDILKGNYPVQVYNGNRSFFSFEKGTGCK